MLFLIPVNPFNIVESKIPFSGISRTVTEDVTLFQIRGASDSVHPRFPSMADADQEIVKHN